MSYCRFSSDDFRSDLYVYANANGYTTHLAARRIVGDIPRLASLADTAEFVESHRRQQEFIEAATYTPIDLPNAGETFEDADIECLIARIEGLVKLGFRVPADVLDELRAERDEHGAELELAAGHELHAASGELTAWSKGHADAW